MSDKKKTPHLALTHKTLQGGSANGRNASLLMKSDITLTDEITKSLVALGINKSAFQSEISQLIQDAVQESFCDEDSWCYVEDYNDSVVIFCSGNGLYSVGYSLVDGEVTLDDLAKPVTEVVTYQPTDGEMLLSEDAEDKLEEGVYSLVTKALKNKSTKEHLIKMFKAQELKKSEVIQLKEEIQKAVEAAETILKAELAAKEAVLQKALGELEVFKTEKVASVTKARKDMLKSVQPEDQVEALFKATEALSDEAFEVMYKSLGGKAKEEKESDLFKEKGISGEGKPEKQEDAHLNLVGELINKSKKTK